MSSCSGEDVCILLYCHLLTTAIYNTAQDSSTIFPPYLQTMIGSVALLEGRGEGKVFFSRQQRSQLLSVKLPHVLFRGDFTVKSQFASYLLPQFYPLVFHRPVVALPATKHTKILPSTQDRSPNDHILTFDLHF